MLDHNGSELKNTGGIEYLDARIFESAQRYFKRCYQKTFCKDATVERETIKNNVKHRGCKMNCNPKMIAYTSNKK